VSSHPSRDGHHAIDHSSFLKLLRQQLDRTLDCDCQPLGLSGARGALFQITLASHGYTMVGKGTVRGFVPDLVHEALVYERLQPLQGTCVPVCLGSVDLAKCYFYDIDVDIVHMLLLSWAGQRIDKVLPDSDEDHPHWKGLVESALGKINQAGVRHNDTVYTNLLWDERDGRIMVIDFERSTLVDQGPPVLSSTQGNKRKCAPSGTEGELSPATSDDRNGLHQQVKKEDQSAVHDNREWSRLNFPLS
jgi:hypothetical protein